MLAAMQLLCNGAAWLGWIAVLFLTLHTGTAPLSQNLLSLTVVCEVFCCLEVLQIALGMIPGRLVLGVILHYTRMLVLMNVIMPYHQVAASLSAKLVIGAWSLTEAFRYPMLLIKQGSPKTLMTLRVLRFNVPILTFPLGAGAEVWAAWQGVSLVQQPLLNVLVMMVIPTNVLGGAAAYPGIIKKGLQSFKTSKPSDKQPKQEGVLFPANSEGKRSTIAGGTRVWMTAAEAADPVLAKAISKEKQWRQKYSKHVVALAEASYRDTSVALKVARAGLATLHETFEFVRDEISMPLSAAMGQPSPERALNSAIVKGEGSLAGLVVPYAGKLLLGTELQAQLKMWSEFGCAEPAAMDAIAAVAAHTDWLDLRGRTFIVLGATSAMGPLSHLLQWGATVIAVARRRCSTWENLIKQARSSAGTLVFPVNSKFDPSLSDAELAQAGGADLLVDTPEIAAWLKQAVSEAASKGSKSITLGVYTYLDGDAHVRVSLACDAIIQQVIAAAGQSCNLSLAYLQTPSLTYPISAAAHAASLQAYQDSKLKVLGLPGNARKSCASVQVKASEQLKEGLLSEVSAKGPRYIHDGLIALQGPNYALAKTMQLWRALLGRNCDGLLVSSNVGPATRTASMVAGNNKNAGAVAASLDGMSHFPPMIVFESDTVTACMSALLVHDVCNPEASCRPRRTLQDMEHPWDLLSEQAFHGGTFRLGIKPQALGPLWYIYGRLFGSAKQPTA